MLPRLSLVVKLNQLYFSYFPSRKALEAFLQSAQKSSGEIKIKIFYSLPSKDFIQQAPSNLIALFPSFYSLVFFKNKIASYPFPCYFFKWEDTSFSVYDILWVNFFTKLPRKKIFLSSYFFVKDLDQKPFLPKILYPRLKKKLFFKNDFLDLSLYHLAHRKLIENLSKKKFTPKTLYFFFFNKLLKRFCH